MTKSWRHVLDSEILDQTLVTISLVVIIAGIGICVAVTSEFDGFSTGYELAEKSCTEHTNHIEFSSHGPGTYEYFSSIYSTLTWCFGVLVILLSVSYFSRSKTLKFITVIMLCVISYQLWIVFNERSLVSDTEVWQIPRYDLLREFIIYDWLVAGITVLLFSLTGFRIFFIPFLRDNGS